MALVGRSKWYRIFQKREERNKSDGIPFFSEKFPVKKPVPFDLPPEQPGFPYKKKALYMFS